MTVLDIFIDRIEPDGTVVGTNNADDVPLGAIFTQLAKIHIDRGNGASIESWSTKIELSLVEAVIFRKNVEAVARGWSAGLRFEGIGMEAIGDALSKKDKGEFIHLRTPDASAK